MSNTETMKEVYLLAQEHCGLKVGDWVRVTREAESYEGGWDNAWVNSDINKLQVRQIGCISEKGIYLDCGQYGLRCYPYFVLEKVKKPEHEFKPFDKVLVRDNSRDYWRIDFFSHMNRDRNNVPFCCLNDYWAICIPFEGNEHLVGTTDKPEAE